MNDRSWIAADGFHPGAPVYAEWARRAVALIVTDAGVAGSTVPLDQDHVRDGQCGENDEH